MREGLDIPEVELVAIFDADKEGFLRNRTSLIQTIGRAARNSKGRVILYADRITDSMKAAIEETQRRRGIQEDFNTEHNITPKTIIKDISNPLSSLFGPQEEIEEQEKSKGSEIRYSVKEIPSLISRMQKEMKKASSELNFELAAELRDKIRELEIYALRFA